MFVFRCKSGDLLLDARFHGSRKIADFHNQLSPKTWILHTHRKKPMKNIKRHNKDKINFGFVRAACPSVSLKAARRCFIQTSLAASGVLLTLTSRSALGSYICKSPSGFLSGDASTQGAPITCTGRSPGYWGTHPEQWPSPYEPGKCGNNDQPSSSPDFPYSSSSHATSSNSETSSKSHASDSPSSSEASSPSSSSNSSSQLFNWNSCTKPSDWNGGTRFRDVFDCHGNGSIYSEYSLMQVICLNGNQDPYQLGAHFVAAMLNAKTGTTPALSDRKLVNIFNEWNSRGFFEPTAGVKWYATDIVAYLQSTLS